MTLWEVGIISSKMLSIREYHSAGKHERGPLTPSSLITLF